METSPQNPFMMPGQPGQTDQQNPAGYTMQPPTPQTQQPTEQNPEMPVKPKSNMAMMLIIGLLMLIIGGVAGYFIGNLLVFKPRLEASDSEKAQLESRVTALENQLASQGSTGTTTTTPTTGTSGTSTTGTGTAPTASGITPDSITETWSTYTSDQFHFTVRHPADYSVTEEPLTDTEAVLKLAIRRTGETAIAGFVNVYPTPDNEGPSTRDITLFAWPDALPTTLQTKPAGAGQVNDITETPVVLNSTQATKLTAVEGKGLEATPGGQTYSAYLVEEQFGYNYLVGGCTTDQTSSGGLVGCPFTTTFSIVR